MIRDFWKIKPSTLFKEIGELEHKIPVMQWKVLDGIRKVGNIGAHMEKDINVILRDKYHNTLDAQKYIDTSVLIDQFA